MREFKFRLWTDKEMIEELNFGGISVAMCMYINRPAMQYTGLKDKNGKEIYEGDIIVQYYPKQGPLPAQLKWIGFVDFDKYWESEISASGKSYTKSFHSYQGYCVKTSNKPFTDEYGNRINATLSLAAQYETEVIGNIMENPELLREKV